MNYDASKVGVPYVRANRLTIYYPTDANPSVGIAQSLAVKLADGSVREIETMPELVAEFDFKAHAKDPLPLVNPENGEPLGSDTNLQQVFLGILSVVRNIQLSKE